MPLAVENALSNNLQELAMDGEDEQVAVDGIDDKDAVDGMDEKDTLDDGDAVDGMDEKDTPDDSDVVDGMDEKDTLDDRDAGDGEGVKDTLDERDALETNWKYDGKNVALYAVRGRRLQMEDRFIIKTNIMGTGISLFGIFDGHAGNFAAEYATTHLMGSLIKKIIEIKTLLDEKNLKKKESEKLTENGKTQIKSMCSVVDSTIDRSKKKRKRKRKNKHSIRNKNADGFVINPSSYLLRGGKINFSKLLFDEILAGDKQLIEVAKLTNDIAGTTALIVLIAGKTLFAANVGDSRGVMCDKKGATVPISFDHKPQQRREKKRILNAGGFISFYGVWRVAGILATSRALGDYPLKEKQFVIANPDILTFDLSHHDPQFIILASDGLWDMFTNEEAVECIKNHIDDSFYGAQYITLESFNKGSLDNITVLVIKFPATWSKLSEEVNNGGCK